MVTATPKQLKLLKTIGTYTNAPSTRRLADRLSTAKDRSPIHTYDEVHSRLRACKRKGLVAVVETKPNRWALTPAGLAIVQAA